MEGEAVGDQRTFSTLDGSTSSSRSGSAAKSLAAPGGAVQRPPDRLNHTANPATAEHVVPGAQRWECTARLGERKPGRRGGEVSSKPKVVLAVNVP
jgi:hypothetical protein